MSMALTYNTGTAVLVSKAGKHHVVSMLQKASADTFAESIAQHVYPVTDDM